MQYGIQRDVKRFVRVEVKKNQTDKMAKSMAKSTINYIK